MPTTFNPNGYNRSQIAAALKAALETQDTIDEITSQVTALQTAYQALGSDVYDLQQANIEIEESVNKVNREVSKVRDILEQITYKGSSNIVTLDPANMSTTSETGFAATMTNGVISIEKDSTTLTEPEITITGINLDAGDYWFILGHHLETTSEIIVYYLYDDDDNIICVLDNTTGAGTANAFTLTEALTGGKIVIVLDKDFTNSGFEVTPCISKSVVYTEDALPYFPSLNDAAS